MWGLRLSPVLLIAAVVHAQVSPLPAPPAGSLLAFSSGKNAPVEVKCEQVNPKNTCLPFASDLLASLGVAACFCAVEGGLPDSAQIESYAKKHGLVRLPVNGRDLDAVIVTKEIKLLTDSEEQRQRAITVLSEMPFIVSPADRSSPYRILVRRKDGGLPTQGDVQQLRDRLHLQVDVEKVSISSKNGVPHL